MALCRKFTDLFCLWTCFVAVLAVEPHPQIKGILPGLYNYISIVDNLLIDTKIKTSLYISLLGLLVSIEMNRLINRQCKASLLMFLISFPWTNSNKTNVLCAFDQRQKKPLTACN